MSAQARSAGLSGLWRCCRGVFFLLREHILVVQCVYIASGKLLVHLSGGVRGVRLVPYFDGSAYIGHMCFRIFPICPAAPFMALKWSLSLAL